MRNLTIKRAKSFVGCLGKAGVYIEDPVANELVVSKVPCRKIGQLKNGEEKTFQIEETAAKVFVIADKLSKDFCNDFYQLPEGQEDIFLSGKNKLSLAVGNPFQFDNNDNKEVIANRKRSARKAPVILGIVIGISVYWGISNARNVMSSPEPQEKTFAYQELSITLTDQFREQDNGKYSRAFSSGDAVVFTTKEPFALMYGFGNYTLEEYAELVLEIGGYTAETLQRTDDHITFSYKFEHPERDVVLWYYSVAYKTENAFWIVQFVVPEEKISNYETQFSEWAETICFSS